MKTRQYFAALLLMAAFQVNAEPLRFEVGGTVSESGDDWADIAGEAVTIQITGDLDTANGTFEMVDNGEEPLFPRYTFSGEPYGVTISGAFGEFSTTNVSFEPIDNFDTDADGNPFGMTGIVDAIFILIPTNEAPESAPFFGGELGVILFHDSDWFDGANSLPTRIDPATLTGIFGVADKRSPDNIDTIVAEATLTYQSLTYINGGTNACTPSGSINVGDSNNGELSRISDCYFEGNGRLRDFTLLTLDEQAAFAINTSSADFSPINVITGIEAPFPTFGSAFDEDGGSSVAREFLLPADTYRVVTMSQELDTLVPPAGDYTLALNAVSEPQLGCQNTTIINANVVIQASLDTNDCQDDTEDRVTFDAYVDGYTAFIAADTTLFATLEADFDATLIWEHGDADDVIQENISAGQAFTQEISAEADLPHTLVIAAADNESLGAYTLTLSDTAPGGGGTGQEPDPGTEPDPGSEPTGPLPEAVRLISIGGDRDAADIRLGAYSDTGEPTYSTDFTTGDFVTIVGEVTPDPEDVGTNGQLFAAMLSLTSGAPVFSFLNADGDFETWDLTIPGLGAAQEVTPLEASHEIMVFEGSLQAGTHKITFAYQAEGGPLVYIKPITISVTE